VPSPCSLSSGRHQPDDNLLWQFSAGLLGYRQQQATADTLTVAIFGTADNYPPGDRQRSSPVTTIRENQPEHPLCVPVPETDRWSQSNFRTIFRDLLETTMEEKSPAQPAASATSTGSQQPLREFPVDASQLTTVYANFARVTGTPEELVLDFGLNTQATPTPNEPVKLTHRVVMSFYTAKRLLFALQMAVAQHEQVYGYVETDVQKRMRIQPRPPATSPSGDR
jgi:hypothetical protein